MALVEIERLTYSYPQPASEKTAPGVAFERAGSLSALSDCSLTIDAGELVLVAGPSGCGKSTLLRAVNGLVPHFYGGTLSGRVRVAGLDTREHTPAGLAHLVACVFQDPEAQIISSTVYEEVVLGLENLGIASEEIAFRAHESLGALGISHLAERSTRALSGGEMQRVAIAAALAMRPALLVLDEPTSQLDPSAAEALLELLRRVNEDSGIAVLVAEHRLERCYHWADRVVVMSDGHILCDAPPADAAAWSLSHHNAFVPPVTRLFEGLSQEPLPLTVKQGRAALRGLLGTHGTPESSIPARGAHAHETPGCGTTAHAAAAMTPPTSAPGPAKDPAVAVRDLRFSYADGREALRGVSVEIARGDVVAIMGENGAGKSTLVRHLNGLNRVQSGSVSLLGRDVRGVPVEELARTCAVLGQNPNDYLFSDTVAQELGFSLAHLRPDSSAADRRSAAESALAALGIADLANAEPRSLSAGQRQRVAIAAMAVADPRVLVLDEPTRGLDWASKTTLGAHLRALQDRGTTVVVVTHDVEFVASFTDRVVVLGAGRVLGEGPTTAVLGSSLFLAPQAARVLGDEFGRGIVTVEAARAALQEALR